MEAKDIAETFDLTVNGRGPIDEDPARAGPGSASVSEGAVPRPRYWQIAASTADHILDIDESRPVVACHKTSNFYGDIGTNLKPEESGNLVEVPSPSRRCARIGEARVGRTRVY